jgi:hypothetical protein
MAIGPERGLEGRIAHVTGVVLPVDGGYLTF